VQKYCDGNLKSTSKGGLKVSETVIMLRERLSDEPLGSSGARVAFSLFWDCCVQLEGRSARLETRTKES
jgi:hypothetical protein